jgi:hypothetical protein
LGFTSEEKQERNTHATQLGKVTLWVFVFRGEEESGKRNRPRRRWYFEEENGRREEWNLFEKRREEKRRQARLKINRKERYVKTK